MSQPSPFAQNYVGNLQQQLAGGAGGYTQYSDPWSLKVRKVENGYIVSSGGKEYACTSGEELPALVQRVLVTERLTGT